MPSKEVKFLNYVAGHGPITCNDYQDGAHITLAVAYKHLKFLSGVAQTFSIEDFPYNAIDLLPPVVPFGPFEEDDELAVVDALWSVELCLNDMRAHNLLEMELEESDDYVALDDVWRGRASSHLSHIRRIVRDANDIEDGLRESINAKISGLETEISRERTRISAVGELLVLSCEAVGKGAKELRPVVELLERMGGAFSGGRRAASHAASRLPSPEKLGLPAPNKSDNNESSNEVDET